MTQRSAVRALAALMIGVPVACASDPATRVPATSGRENAPVTTVVAITPPEPTVDTIEIVRTVRGVDYYGACGNEILELDGERWYPIASEDLGGQPFDTTRYAALPPVAPSLVRVAPPGPGDDTGTLYVFADGIGRFVSDSGLIDNWLTTVEQEYLFAC